MDWLEELADRRRVKSTTFAALEANIEAEDGGYEVELVVDGEGKPLSSPILVAAGDAAGVYHV
jgi:hypothetical protein